MFVLKIFVLYNNFPRVQLLNTYVENISFNFCPLWQVQIFLAMTIIELVLVQLSIFSPPIMHCFSFAAEYNPCYFSCISIEGVLLTPKHWIPYLPSFYMGEQSWIVVFK